MDDGLLSCPLLQIRDHEVHLISAGVDVTVIRNWLGHVHLDTTNHYAQASLEMKRKALEQVDSKLLSPQSRRAGSKTPICWSGSIRCETEL